MTSADRRSTGDEVVGGRPTAWLCQLRRSADFRGYGFQLVGMRGRRGQYVQAVERGSPAAAAEGGPRVGDRLVEVNGVDVACDSHQQVELRRQ